MNGTSIRVKFVLKLLECIFFRKKQLSIEHSVSDNMTGFLHLWHIPVPSPWCKIFYFLTENILPCRILESADRSILISTTWDDSICTSNSTSILDFSLPYKGAPSTTDHSSPFKTKVTAQSYISSPPYIFMTWYFINQLITHKDYFTLLFMLLVWCFPKWSLILEFHLKLLASVETRQLRLNAHCIINLYQSDFLQNDFEEIISDVFNFRQWCKNVF
jgi:hypothetical protein